MFVLQVGAALNFDLLKYNEDTLTAFLRVYSKWVQQHQHWEDIFTPPKLDFYFLFNVYVCVCFQGFGEAVELPDSAGLLPEPGLCLQSAAGQQTSLQLRVQKWSVFTESAAEGQAQSDVSVVSQFGGFCSLKPFASDLYYQVVCDLNLVQIYI